MFRRIEIVQLLARVHFKHQVVTRDADNAPEVNVGLALAQHTSCNGCTYEFAHPNDVFAITPETCALLVVWISWQSKFCLNLNNCLLRYERDHRLEHTSLGDSIWGIALSAPMISKSMIDLHCKWLLRRHMVRQINCGT